MSPQPPAPAITTQSSHFLQNVWPTGHAPKNARTADKTTRAVTEDDVNGGRSKSLA